MKISVVTVCWNSAQTIEVALRSVQRQTHRDREHLIVDGASTDDTPEILRKYAAPGVRVVSEPDRGIYDAMNKGLRLFSGDAVGFLNSDDCFHDETAIARIAEALEHADIVYGDVDMVKDHGSKLLVRKWRGGGYHRRSFQLGWMPPHPTFYVRRHVVDAVGMFDLNYRITADYDYTLRAMALNAFRIAYIPHVLVDFKMGGASNKGWRQTLRVNVECLRSRRDHLGAAPVDAAFLLRPLRRMFQVRRFGEYFFRRG